MNPVRITVYVGLIGVSAGIAVLVIGGFDSGYLGAAAAVAVVPPAIVGIYFAAVATLLPAASAPRVSDSQVEQNSEGAGSVQVGRDVHGGVHITKHGPEPAPADVPAPADLFSITRVRSREFHGRAGEISDIEKRLAARSSPRVAVTLSGLGGIGKTELAIEVAHRLRDRFNPVWQVRAETRDALLADLISLTDPMRGGSTISRGQTLEGRAAWAFAWLRAHDGWLLLLDNVEDAEVLRDVLGQVGGGGTIIVTSRLRHGWSELSETIVLDGLEEDDALAMLQDLAPSAASDESGARALVRRLDGMPLLLVQASAVVQQDAIGFVGYLDKLDEVPERVMGSPNTISAERTWARVWEVSLRAIADADRSETALELLRVLGWFAPEETPRELLGLSGVDRLDADEALGTLNAYSMIELSPDEVSVHRAVQLYSRVAPPISDLEPADAAQSGLRRAYELVEAAWPPGPIGPDESARCARMISSVDALLEHTPQGVVDWLVVGLSALLGDEAADQGQTRAAIRWLKHGEEAASRMHGQSSRQFEQARGRLAYAFDAAGFLNLSVEIYEELREAQLKRAETDTDFANSTVNNLAEGYTRQDKAPQAIALLDPIVQARAHLPLDAEAVRFRSNLGLAYIADDQLERAVDIYDHLLQSRAPAVAAHELEIRNNLAGAYKEAFLKDLKIRDLSSLACLTVALDEFTAVHATLSRMMTRDHPQTLRVQHNMGHALDLAGRTAEAVALHLDTFVRCVGVLGPEHPTTISAGKHLMGCVAEAGITEADFERLANTAAYERSLRSDLDRALGPLFQIVGYVACDSGRFEVGREYWEAASEILVGSEGADDPRVAELRKNAGASRSVELWAARRFEIHATLDEGDEL